MKRAALAVNLTVIVTVTVAAGALGIPAASAAATGTVTVDERMNHQTLTVHRGDRIELVLHNTYWSIDQAHRKALKTASTQGTQQGKPGPGCRTGSGCGTVTRYFVAQAAGNGWLSASRTTCGEALHCSTDQGTYHLTVRVMP